MRRFDQEDAGATVQSDGPIGPADPDNYDLLVLPGGYINPDLLRRDEKAVAFVRALFSARKPVGVICHGPWTLIEADAIRGRRLAAVESLKTDIRSAGGEWLDADVHVDHGENLLAGGRNYRAVEQFTDALILETAALRALGGGDWLVRTTPRGRSGQGGLGDHAQRGRRGVQALRDGAEEARRASENTIVYVELPGAQHSFDLLCSIRFEAVIDAVEAFANQK